MPMSNLGVIECASDCTDELRVNKRSATEWSGVGISKGRKCLRSSKCIVYI